MAQEFDGSYKRGQPATFPLTRVIPCLTDGVQKIMDQLFRHALGRDGEMRQRTLGPGAPQAVGFDLDGAEGILFQAGRHARQPSAGRAIRRSVRRHLRTDRIVKDGFAQEGRLRGCPEVGFVQQHISGQRVVAFDEACNRGLVVGLAKLGKQVAQVVHRAFP